ncbi:hypothetical protein [Mammaliicoccus sciuri]|uniref:hypothetical protein n=1 Tax=Mammaliicoccus sciuri TaxID=1296 RepID=UPI001E443BA0|nr:hypothetical protein [Mammaliicoccus sciuri]MCD8898480.1 hypothetical protein [Mammaliicoccus sciuri]
MNTQALKFVNNSKFYTLAKHNIGKGYTCIVVFENRVFLGLLDIPVNEQIENVLLDTASKIKKDVTFLEKTHA